MPKQTFFNLPEEKRTLITEIVVDEFAENDYENVSISRIVQRAGIAKGSFYQYFEDKDDLYGYVVDLITKAKAAMFSLDHPDPNRLGIFNYLRWILQNSVEFELRNPRFSRIGYRMLKGNTSENPIYRQAVEKSLAYYESLVRLGKEQGDIAPDIDDKMAAEFFQIIMTEIGPRIIREAIEEHGTAWHGQQPLFDFPEVQEKYGQMLRMLEYGLSGQPAAQADAPVDAVIADEGA